jgi:hypothetical protein
MLNPELGAKGRFNHDRINDLLQNQLTADPGATYAKSLYLNLQPSPPSSPALTPLRSPRTSAILKRRRSLSTRPT